MTDQTLTDWCNWLRNDLAYRAPELWPAAIDAWRSSTEQRFGERTEGAGDDERPDLIDRDGDRWAWINGAYHSLSSPCAREEVEQVWAPVTEDVRAASPVLPSGGQL